MAEAKSGQSEWRNTIVKRARQLKRSKRKPYDLRNLYEAKFFAEEKN